MPEKATIPRVCKQCGKDFLATAGNVAQGYGHYCSRSCARKTRTGENGTNWRGGRIISRGYVMLLMPEHPDANPLGYVREHRLVMERELGRPLTDDEVVHHISGITTDNRPWNLVVMTKSEHTKLHHPLSGRWALNYDACVECGTTERPHEGHGLCHNCLSRAAYHRRTSLTR